MSLSSSDSEREWITYRKHSRDVFGSELWARYSPDLRQSLDELGTLSIYRGYQ
jgi:hypothetical protein